MKGWAVDTTARNPQRIKEILRLFEKHFNGKLWDESTQSDFTLKLIRQKLYQPRIVLTKKIRALRGRTWAAVLNRMGFARAYSGQAVSITPVGRRLLRKDADESTIFLRQLMKWQFPSPIERRVQKVNLRPFVAVAYLLKNLGSLSKNETAIFVFTLLDGRSLVKVSAEISRFREKLRVVPDTSREGFMEQEIRKRLDKHRLTIKEAKRWLANYREYADTLMRYLAHTNLFSLMEGKLFLPLKNQYEVEWILQRFSSNTGDFGRGKLYLQAYYDPDQPVLAWEDPKWLQSALKRVEQDIQEVSGELASIGHETRMSIPPSLFKPAKTAAKLRSQLQKATRPLELLVRKISNLKKIENAGMLIALQHERTSKRRPRDVSDEFRGYDIFSEDHRDKRYIEVKAFAGTGPLYLTAHEWLVARRFGRNYWIYVVENSLDPVEQRLHEICNPFRKLSHLAQQKTTLQYKIVVRNWKTTAKTAQRNPTKHDCRNIRTI